MTAKVRCFVECSVAGCGLQSRISTVEKSRYRDALRRLPSRATLSQVEGLIQQWKAKQEEKVQYVRCDDSSAGN